MLPIWSFLKLLFFLFASLNRLLALHLWPSRFRWGRKWSRWESGWVYNYFTNAFLGSTLPLMRFPLVGSHISICIHLHQDTAGSERYEAMSRIYYRGARAAIVCYGKPRSSASSSVLMCSKVVSRISASLRRVLRLRLHKSEKLFVMHNNFVVESVEKTDSLVVSSDLTDSSSFQRARFWVKELQNCEEVRELLKKRKKGKLTAFQSLWDLISCNCQKRPR